MSRYFNQMDIDSGNELEHYGVKGMKWGVRNYTNANGTLNSAGQKRYYTSSSNSRKVAKGYTRRLNDVDKYRAHYQKASEYHKGVAGQYESRYNKQIAKYGKANTKYEQSVQKRGYDSRTTARLGRKSDKAFDRSQKSWDAYQENSKLASKYQRTAKAAERETKAILAEANSKGYRVHSKETQRFEDSGKAALAALGGGLLAGPVGAAASASAYMQGPQGVTRGTSYKVKAPSKKNSSVSTTVAKKKNPEFEAASKELYKANQAVGSYYKHQHGKAGDSQRMHDEVTKRYDDALANYRRLYKER